MEGGILIPESGGFTALKQEAVDANARVRLAGGDPTADALARAKVIRAEAAALNASGAVLQPEPVRFGCALRAVLAGPHVEAQPKHGW